ncbi:hypothetical protein CYK37_20670 [Mesorhizobium loti]|nr:DUF2235 domain-containing protein [Mesorhizobium loti]PLP57538.1 hypothetical protein CYK37_20670 [Mesorhizobium loti]
MPKNLVVCLDGTWNNSISGEGVGTNINAIYNAVSLENQVKSYSQGVGEHVGWFSRRAYGISGKGAFQTARSAWKWVAGNYQDGDKIYIFGFSRGAFVARHLAAMLVRHGMRAYQGRIEQSFREYLATANQPCTTPQGEVCFLGLFDCVPGNQLYVLRDRSHHLNNAVLEPGIRHFRHAVSVDERRWSFRPIIFEESGNQETFKQHWFPGCHSDVGGGDKCAEGLAAFSLWWMLREAFGAGLNFQNVECRYHNVGNALSVINAVDPHQKPVSSDYPTTRLGLRCHRADIDLKKQVSPVPSFAEMDVCPRCNLDMFDVFRTDFGTAWLAAKGLGRSRPAGGFQGKT